MINVKDIINDYRIHKNDNGSSSIQVFLLSIRIKKLQKHLSIFKKDFHSRLGLLKLIFLRRKLLKYIKFNNLSNYNLIIKKLKIHI